MAKLRFEIDGEPTDIAFQSFVSASARFLGLLREIDQVMTGRYLGTLRWYVARLHSNGGLSVEVLSRVKPPAKTAKRKDPLPDFSRSVAGSLVTGFDNIQNLGVSPPYLSQYGLQNLEEMLTMLERNGARAYRATDLDDGRSVALSADAAKTVRSLIPTRRKTIGSVEGQLEAISIHRKPKFVVYDALTKKAITCEFDDSLLGRVKDTLGLRVLVSGVVHWNIKSEPKRVDVEDIRVLGEGHLPTTADLSGAYPDITDGLTTEQYIRSIRGD